MEIPEWNPRMDLSADIAVDHGGESLLPRGLKRLSGMWEKSWSKSSNKKLQIRSQIRIVERSWKITEESSIQSGVL
jgi:hypothetical protein